jgi:hypothetical protein
MSSKRIKILRIWWWRRRKKKEGRRDLGRHARSRATFLRENGLGI